MKKKYLLIPVAIALLIVAGVGAFMVKNIKDEKMQSGILLAFDLFDEYDVRVTFFVNVAEPDEFRAEAKARGHEIGFHTVGHMDLSVLEEQYIIEQAIEPIEEFRRQGYGMKAFAYPYGAYTEATNELLFEHYDVLRGAYRHELRAKDEVQGTLLESKSIDNVNYVDMPEFEREIMASLMEAYENPGTVVSFYSHSINDWAEWAVPVERLEFLFRTAENLGLEFYTYSDLIK